MNNSYGNRLSYIINLLICFTLPLLSNCQTTGCENADFEMGDTSNWSYSYTGNWTNSVFTPSIDLGPMNGSTGNQAIMGPGAGMDQTLQANGVSLPRVDPSGGDYSLRLGDEAINGYNAAKASYTFVVGPNSEFFAYHFAPVLQNPLGHTQSLQPLLSVTLYVNGNSVPCMRYNISGMGSADSFEEAGSIYYMQWQTVGVSLKPYIGQTATIEFMVQDCGLGGHWAYAYIECECSPTPKLEQKELTCNQPIATINAPKSASAYQWSGPGIVGDADLDSVQVNEGGHYQVIVTPSPGGCPYILEVDVLDKRGEVVADFDTSPEEICLGEEISFDNQTTHDQLAGSIVDVVWDFGDGTQSQETHPVHEFTSVGTYSIQLSATSATGCFDSIIKDVLVSPNPTADFNVNTVCEGEVTTPLDVSTLDPISGNLITQWNWNYGDGNTSTYHFSNHTYANENKYDLTLTVTSNKGCVNSITKDAIVYPNPEINFTPTEACFGKPIQFQGSAIVNNEHTQNNIDEYRWYFGDGQMSNIQNPNHDYLSDGTYNVVFKSKSNHGCESSLTKLVTVFPRPIAQFSGVDLLGCSPICPIITSGSVINNDSIVNYEWTLTGTDGSDTLIEGYKPTLSNCFNNSTGEDIFYDVGLKVTSSHGCIDSDFKSEYIGVYHLPIADFYYAPNEVYVYDTDIEFFNTSHYADKYNWLIANTTNTTEEEPKARLPEVPGDYPVELIALTYKGCRDTIIKAIKVNDEVIFYVPNTFTPDNDDFNETFKPIMKFGIDPQTYTLQIFNRWGEIVFESHDINKGWDGSYTISRNKPVKTGTYVWKIEFKVAETSKRKTFMGHVNLLK